MVWRHYRVLKQKNQFWVWSKIIEALTHCWPLFVCLQEAEYNAAKAEIESSENRLAEKDDLMSNMQSQLVEAREQATKDQEALLKAMEQMHVKEDKEEEDTEHGGMYLLFSAIHCRLMHTNYHNL